MALIDNIDQAHKLTSVQLAGLGVALSVADQVLPQLQAVMPPWAYAIVFALTAVARVIKQPSLGASGG